jgi:multiple sugar transport system substrate-binding protein
MIGDQLIVFPVSKSTHLLFINGTQFERFCADTGASCDDLATWEGFFEVAEKYYNWSGGKCFCAFDYMLRCVELHAQGTGTSLMTEDGWYDFDNEALRDSWMMFAEPLAKGHISVSNLYSNTQVMTGEVCASLGSSAAILYYNDNVTYPDNTTEPINLKVLPLPQEPGRNPLVTQAGVGLIARKTTEQKAEAAAVFARWLTEGERNLAFVTETGYMPVNNGAFDAIDHFEFADSGYASLYAALMQTREKGILTQEPSFTGYYGKVTALYDGLRGIQDSLEMRANAGEDIASLAEETWQLFSAIR